MARYNKTKYRPTQKKMYFNVYTPEKYESICVRKKDFNFQITHWISGNTRVTIDRSIVFFYRLYMSKYVKTDLICENLYDTLYDTVTPKRNTTSSLLRWSTSFSGGYSMNVIIHTTSSTRRLPLPSGISTKILQHTGRPTDQPTNQLSEKLSANSYTPELKIQS